VMAGEPRVLIVDDDPSARRGLTRLIRAAGMEAESFSSAVDLLASGLCDGPGCMVLDVRMPQMSGPELQEKLRQAECGMPIIFVSGHGDVPITAEAMKKGAVDFLTKPVDRDDLLAAVRASLARDAETRAKRAEVGSIQSRLETLTPREHDVLKHVIAGLLNKQIAAELGVSEDTVKSHRGRVMQKFGVVSVAELVRLCEQVGVAPVR
jgi:FixJ family two-component response regulator